MYDIYLLDESEWSMLLQDVADHFDDLTIKRGYSYYKQDRVNELLRVSGRIFEAEVQGGDLYRTELNLDFFAASQCDCPFEGYCKHMVAALLQLAEQARRPVQMVANAKAYSDRPKTEPAPPRRMQTAEVQRVREGEIQMRAERIPQMTVQEWRELFALCLAPMEAQVRNNSFADKALSAIESCLKSELSEAKRRLFRLHSRLIVLEKLLEPQSQGGYGHFIGFYTKAAAQDLHLTIVQLLTEDFSSGAAVSWEELSETVDLLRSGMLARSHVQPYYNIYYGLIWRSWLGSSGSLKRMAADELARLQAAERGIGPQESGSLLIAQCRMHALLEHDEEAWKLIPPLAELSGPHDDALLDLADGLVNDGRWRRAAAWLERLEPMLNYYDRDFTTHYLGLWQKTIPHLPEAEDAMWRTLKLGLPQSRAYYENMLYNLGRWQEWMDCQLVAGTEPLSLRADSLKPLEKEAPELLLPFYHQAVERYVLLKNRDGYKAAVKLLKRLAKLYRKLKREERWERFLESFAGRHSRLRALQEEMRKGKLLS